MLYHRLSQDRFETRLLTLHPGTDSDPIQCSLRHLFLDVVEKPSYETISYCWGDASIRDSIVVDNQALDVAASTAAALRCMRQKDSGRVLWIDGVCINQGDADERGHQVSHMAIIYHSSQGNLIHLSGGTATASEAGQSIKNICDEAYQETNGFKDFHAVITKHQQPADLNADIAEAALRELFANPFFSRLWMLQEIVLAPKNTMFYAGQVMDLLSVSRSQKWLFYKKRDIERSTRLSLYNFSKLLGVYATFQEDDVSGYQEMAVSTLITHTRGLVTTLPHDKIYALLGLFQWLRAGDSLHGAPPPPFKANYQLEPTSVFRDATRAVILESQTLHILDRRRIRDDYPYASSLPSWTPAMDLMYDKDLDTVGLHAGFRAAGSSVVRSGEIDDTQDPNCLKLSGFSLDRVSFVTPVITLSKLQDPQYVWSLLETLLKKIPEGVDPLDRFRVWGRTLIAGVNQDDDFASAEDADWIHLLTQYLREKRWFPPEFVDPSDKFRYQASQYRSSLIGACNNRRLFVLPSGLGLGPKDAEAGDELVILEGGPWPFLIRPLRSGFSFVGSCYVDGVMNGEEWKKRDKYEMKVYDIY